MILSQYRDMIKLSFDSVKVLIDRPKVAVESIDENLYFFWSDADGKYRLFW